MFPAIQACGERPGKWKICIHPVPRRKNADLYRWLELVSIVAKKAQAAR
jgi:hypothetical protein